MCEGRSSGDKERTFLIGREPLSSCGDLDRGLRAIPDEDDRRSRVLDGAEDRGGDRAVRFVSTVDSCGSSSIGRIAPELAERLVLCLGVPGGVELDTVRARDLR